MGMPESYTHERPPQRSHIPLQRLLACEIGNMSDQLNRIVDDCTTLVPVFTQVGDVV